MYVNLLALFSLGSPEVIVILIAGILIFGNRLPGIARNVGRGVIEFKKGLKGIESDISEGATSDSTDSVAKDKNDVTKEPPA